MNEEITPPNGVKWIKLVPTRVKIAAPIIGVLLTFGGGVAGASLKFGSIVDRVSTQGARIDSIELKLAAEMASISHIRETVGELRGRLDALLAYFNIRYPNKDAHKDSP
jgi:hypothetical protein